MTHSEQFWNLKKITIKTIKDSVEAIIFYYRNREDVVEKGIVNCNKIGLTLDGNCSVYQFDIKYINCVAVFDSDGEVYSFDNLDFLCLCQLADDISEFVTNIRKNKIDSILEE
jgi:hypothetical protein